MSIEEPFDRLTVPSNIEGLRGRIDKLDAEIVRLLNARAELAAQIGKLKQQNSRARPGDGSSRDPGSPVQDAQAVYVPEREEQVLRRVEQLSAALGGKGLLSGEAMRAIYSEVISACRALERRPRVAYLGPEGTFTHQGARARFGSSADLIPVKTIQAAFTAVVRSDADYSVVPIENSSDGAVGETLDALIDSPLRVCGEIHIAVHHNLMARCDPANAGRVRKIYSKVQVFAQCGEWLAANMADVELVDAGSTTQAAQRAAQEEGAAAIAHEQAARIYGLTILSRHIEDDPRNATRFFVLGKESARPTGNDKTSLLCFIKDEVGALLHLLEPFRANGLNLTSIQSRPSKRRMWDYCFFIDFEGHVEDPNVSPALEQVRAACREVRVLGSYPVSNSVAI